MKNKVTLRKHLIIIAAVILVSAVFLTVFSWHQYNNYNQAYNIKLGSIIAAVKDKYPEVTDKQIVELLNSDNEDGLKTLLAYGIDLDKDAVIIANKQKAKVYMIASGCFTVFYGGLLVALFLIYDRKRDAQIKEITACIERINRQEYELDMSTMSEDELSILKNEIYKTTVMLREAAENAGKDRLSLKTSIEDISHQLKTPLTSIMIMLDDLIDDPQMPTEQQQEFLQDIKRETSSISFLVQNLLKLSRLEANAVVYNRKDADLAQIVKESVLNVAALCDLRNINVVTKTDEAKAYCDPVWQKEAITNILKNSIEHSNPGQSVEISCGQTSVYSYIEIRDHGSGISSEDLPHIFERFYRSEKSAPDSVGIGLALAKRAVEEDGGTISVDSSDSGTVFKIRYFRQQG